MFVADAEAVVSLKSELIRRFPSHGLMNAMGILYPQYWARGNTEAMELNFPKHLRVLADFLDTAGSWVRKMHRFWSLLWLTVSYSWRNNGFLKLQWGLTHPRLCNRLSFSIRTPVCSAHWMQHHVWQGSSRSILSLSKWQSFMSLEVLRTSVVFPRWISWNRKSVTTSKAICNWSLGCFLSAFSISKIFLTTQPSQIGWMDANGFATGLTPRVDLLCVCVYLWVMLSNLECY